VYQKNNFFSYEMLERKVQQRGRGSEPAFRGIDGCIKDLPLTKKCTGNVRQTSYFLSRLVNQLKFKDVCVAAQPYSFIITIYENGGFGIPPDFTKFIETCPKVIIFIPVILQGENMGHYNTLIIDKKRKEHERFEPHGHATYSSDFSNLVDKVLKTELKFPYRSAYIETGQFCPRVGPQHFENLGHCPYGVARGFCVTWSTLYAHLRLTNPLHGRERVVEELLKGDEKEKAERIMKYQTLIDKVITEEEVEKIRKLEEEYSRTEVSRKPYKERREELGKIKAKIDEEFWYSKGP